MQALPPLAWPAPARPESPAEPPGVNPLVLLDIVAEHRWLIGLATALGLALGAGYARITPPIYEANALIQVEDNKVSTGVAMGKAESLMEVRSSAAAEVEILRSRMVVGQAVANLQLDLDIQPRKKPGLASWLSRPVPLGERLQVQAFELPAAYEGRAFTLRATVTGFVLLSPEGAVLAAGRAGQPLGFRLGGQDARLLVSRLDAAVGEEFSLVRVSRLSATEALQGALQIGEQGRGTGVIKASLQGPDPVRIARVLNEIATLFVGQNIDRKSVEVAKSLAFLDEQLPALRHTLEDSETRFNRFRRQVGVFELGAEAEDILKRSSGLQVQLTELHQKRSDLAAEVTAEHPGMQRLEQQIGGIRQELDRLAAKARTLPNTEQDLLRLTREVKVNAELYSSVLNNYQQLRLAKESKVGNVRIVDVAVAPEAAIKPRRGQVVGVAGAAGLLLGVAVALLRRGLQRGMKRPGDVERLTGLHVFATLPLSARQAQLGRLVRSRVQGVHVLAQVAPQEPAVESVRSLRAALQFALRQEPGSLVLFTGPAPGVGKSFVSVNLAAVLGAAGKRVLLIDADLRKGQVHRHFGVGRAPGFSEVVSGAATLEEAVRRRVLPNVDLLAAGLLPPNPADLLLSAATAPLLKAVSRQYDLVILDSSPVLFASETALLAAQAHAVFLVARAEQTSAAEIEACGRRLGQSGARVSGVIFNALKPGRRGSGYGYAYGQGYGAGAPRALR